MGIRPKKSFGQHFLTNKSIAISIINVLELEPAGNQILEIGPGTGMLTKILVTKSAELRFVEVDAEAVEYLMENMPEISTRIIHQDFMKLDLSKVFDKPFSIIGNFPYNISSQIFFKILENRNLIGQVVCMIQKEVAQRITAPPGSKTYGILSVLLQAYYDTTLQFIVKPGSFYPPPKIDSAVIKLIRNSTTSLPCDEALFFRIVKQGFQNRRKTLRNALKPINLPGQITGDPLLDRRAETLSVDDYVYLTSKTQEAWKK